MDSCISRRHEDKNKGENFSAGRAYSKRANKLKNNSVWQNDDASSDQLGQFKDLNINSMMCNPDDKGMMGQEAIGGYF